METVGLALPDTPGISADTQRIDVRIEIKEQIRTRQFLHIPLRVLNAPNKGSSIALAPETINLTLSGAQQRVDRIRLKTSRPMFDVTIRCEHHLRPSRPSRPSRRNHFEQHRAKRGQSFH